MPKWGSGDRGGARGSWRLQASALGALHRHAKASGRGTRIEARRSDSSRSTPFDEGDGADGSGAPPKGARQRASAAGERPSRWLNRPRRGRAARKALRSRAYRSEQGGSKGKPEDIESQTKAGGPPSSGFPPEVISFARVSARVGGRGSQPRTRKRTRRVIRESSDTDGCSCRVVGCRSRNEASSWPGWSAPQGEPSLDEVA